MGTTATCAAALGVPFGYHSALKSEGTGLLYFRNRWYSTTAAQWLSQDPLGPVDSHNLYAFNGFDSVNFVDPWGLKITMVGDNGDMPLSHPCSAATDPNCLARSPRSWRGGGART